VIAYKFLRAGQVGPFSGQRWAAGGDWVLARPGDRVHACRTEDLAEWLDDELWRVELDGDVAVEHGVLVADRGRLLERVAGWDPGVAAELADECTRRAQAAALQVLGSGPAQDALARCTSPVEVRDVSATLDLDPRAARAVGYAGDTARHAISARERPNEASMHAAVNGFIAAHAAAFAADDVAVAAPERASQGVWLAARLAL
jgi:hypothetical protein